VQDVTTHYFKLCSANRPDVFGVVDIMDQPVPIYDARRTVKRKYIGQRKAAAIVPGMTNANRVPPWEEKWEPDLAPGLTKARGAVFMLDLIWE